MQIKTFYNMLNLHVFFSFCPQRSSSVKAVLLVQILNQTCVNCVREVKLAQTNAKPAMMSRIMATVEPSGPIHITVSLYLYSCLCLYLH